MASPQPYTFLDEARIAEFLHAYRQARGVGSDSYAAYMKAYGTDAAAQLRETLTDTKRRHDRTGAKYGDTAEALGRAGGAAGYRDYLTLVNRRSLESENRQARDTYRETLRQNEAGYASYLNQQSSRIRNAVKDMRSQRITEYNDAYAYALASGIDDDTAHMVADLVDGLPEKPLTATEKKFRQELLHQMIYLGLTRDSAYRYALSSGMTPSMSRELAEACHIATTERNALLQ